MSGQSWPRARGAARLPPDTARGPLAVITRSPFTKPHPQPSRQRVCFPARLYPQPPPATSTHTLLPPSPSLVSTEETATVGPRGMAQGEDLPKTPTQHPRTAHSSHPTPTLHHQALTFRGVTPPGIRHPDC